MAKHQWLTYADTYGDDDSQQINIMAWAEGYHNGPKCKACGYFGCHHCNRGMYDEECPAIVEGETAKGKSNDH